MEEATRIKPRMEAGERRGLIERAAGQLFGRRGYSATRLDDIAAAAGVTKPMVYRHFSSKKDLYLALLSRHEADLPTFIGVEVSAELGPAELIDAILDGWLDYVTENSFSWLIIFRDKTGDPDIERARDGVNRRAREVLAAFTTHVRPGLAPELVEPCAEFLSRGLAGLVLWWIDHPDVPRERVHAAASRSCRALVGV